MQLKPYYEDEWCQLYCDDARNLTFASDLILTDPPYGINFISNQNRKKSFNHITGDDSTLDVINTLRPYILKLHTYRHVYVFGEFDLSSLPLGGLAELIWDKVSTGAGNLNIPWSKSYEKVQFGTYVPSTKNRSIGYGNGAARLRRGSVLTYQRITGSATTRHPTEKPIDLLREFIESSSHIRETVLDPFAGSGSTLVAAKLEGRKSIGIEIEERYCEVAAKRIAEVEWH